MSVRHIALAAVAVTAFGVACSSSSGPSDPPQDSNCDTDLSCPFGQECRGNACANIAPSLHGHIQLASALLRAPLDAGEQQWRAQHFDLVIGMTDADVLRAANPNVRMFDYFNMRYYLFEPDASVWAAAHGADVEDFYLHYREDTVVPTWESYQFFPGQPAGVVPGWNPGGPNASATSRDQSRVPGFSFGLPSPWYLANVDNAQYRQFLRSYARDLIDGDKWYNGFASGPIDGVMCDNAIYYALFNEGKLENSTEFYGVPMTDDHPYSVAFENLYPELAHNLTSDFASTRDIMPNYGHVLFLNYPDRASENVQTTTPWIWGEVWVTYTGQSSPTTGGNRCITYEKDYVNAVTAICAQTHAGGRRILGARDTASGTAGTDRGRLFTLGLYYLLHNAHTYYMYETVAAHAGGGHLSTWGWNPAVEFDVGQADQVPVGTLDYAGKANTKEHYVFATGPDPYNPALTYRVLARNFTNALVLVKLLPEGSVVDDQSITVHPLGSSYTTLLADGTVGPVVTDAVIRNNEALILIR